MPGFFIIDGEAYEASLAPGAPPAETGAVVAVADDRFWVHLAGAAYELVWRDAISHFAGAAEAAAENVTRAPMPGLVVAVEVAAGDLVEPGDAMMVIESMKLETVVRAPRAGVVETVHLAIGDAFERAAALVSLRGEAEPA